MTSGIRPIVPSCQGSVLGLPAPLKVLPMTAEPPIDQTRAIGEHLATTCMNDRPQGIAGVARFAAEAPMGIGGGASCTPPSAPPPGNTQGGDGTITMKINDLMKSSGTGFGTSGVRGLVTALTDQVSYAYTLGFIRHLESTDELVRGSDAIAVAGDLRPSSPRIMRAVGRAIADAGYMTINVGLVPSPTIAYYGIKNRMPTVMVTGSHIPADRNGIKFNKKAGEILKYDEEGIRGQEVTWKSELFAADGSFAAGVATELPAVERAAERAFVERYLKFFPPFLKGQKVALYAHSAVGRDMLQRVLEGLGARVDVIGASDTFIPVDTEAIRDEDTALAKSLAGKYFAIVSTDGDSDRPLVAGSDGRWLRGDVLGIIVSDFLQADAVATPVSCNSALEKTRRFAQVLRTKIGSPFVIEAMQRAADGGAARVVGYEANGGFLTATNIEKFDDTLDALPTRDSFLPILAALWQAIAACRCRMSWRICRSASPIAIV